MSGSISHRSSPRLIPSSPAKTKTAHRIDHLAKGKSPRTPASPQRSARTPKKKEFNDNMRNPVTDIKAHFKLKGNSYLRHESPKRPHDVQVSSPSSLSKRLCHEPQTIASDSSICVAVRIRPFSDREKAVEDSNCLASVCDKDLLIKAQDHSDYVFSYDKCFWSVDPISEVYASQEAVYCSIGKPLLDSTLMGYNTCLFAYGQTGSGKSFTVMGTKDEDAGIVPRFCREMFRRILHQREREFVVEFSYFEIYNENIHDLLFETEGQTKKKLKVREHPENGPYVQGLSVSVVKSFEEVQAWIAVGNKRRATAATAMNDKSSRSHSVIALIVTQVENEVCEGARTQFTKRSRVNIIDLAGSERATHVNDESQANFGNASTRLKEGSCINRSLHTLGKVISVLSDESAHARGKQTYIPYRDSVLTWLLKDSLGGNSKTAIIATISPSTLHYGETLSTLRYAAQARRIVNKAKVNEDANTKIIRDLLAEIELLRRTGTRETQTEQEDIAVLKGQLEHLQSTLAESARLWKERSLHSSKQHQYEADQLKSCGVTFAMDKCHPCLVNLNEDPQLSEVLFYVLQPGSSMVGTTSSDSPADIRLKGALIADKHCLITTTCNEVLLEPQDGDMTFVNGIQVTQRTPLSHGDRIVLGGDQFFRLNNPREAASAHSDDVLMHGFQFAKEEFLQAQNQRFAAEFDSVRVKAEQEFVKKITDAKASAVVELHCQRAVYEDQLDAIQRQLATTEDQLLTAETQRLAANDQLSRVRCHNKAIENEIICTKRRLEEEAVAAKKAFEEAAVNQLKIVDELEGEKTKIERGIAQLKSSKAIREHLRQGVRQVLGCRDQDTSTSSPDFIRLLLMLREANKISQRLNKQMVFTREDVVGDDKVSVRVRINNTMIGQTALVEIDVFEHALLKMRDFSHDDDEGEGDDPFQFPSCEWTTDFRLDPSEATDLFSRTTRLSIDRRRSLALLANLNQSLSERRHLDKTFTVRRRTIQDNLRRLSSSASILEVTEDEASELTASPSHSKKHLGALRDHSTSDRACVEWYSSSPLLNDSQGSSIYSRIMTTVSLVHSSLKRDRCEMVPWAVLLCEQCSMVALVHSAWSLSVSEAAVAIQEQALSALQEIKQHCDNDVTEGLLMAICRDVACLTLIGVDQIVVSDGSFFGTGVDSALTTEFFGRQSALLADTISRGLGQVQLSLQPIKTLQISHEHKISWDTVDDVLNVLLSSLTLLQTADVFARAIGVASWSAAIYTHGLCLSQRAFVTALSSLADSCKNLSNELIDASVDRDFLSDVIGTAADTADVARSLAEHACAVVDRIRPRPSTQDDVNDNLIVCRDRLLFAAKAVRVACTIVIDAVSKQLLADQPIDEQRGVQHTGLTLKQGTTRRMSRARRDSSTGRIAKRRRTMAHVSTMEEFHTSPALLDD